MWIALRMRYEVKAIIAPFESEEDAEQWIIDNANDPREWGTMEAQSPIDPPKAQ